MVNKPEQIIERICELRDILGLDAADIAGKLGISEQDYLDYESGRVSIPINTLYTLAGIFGVDVTVLLTGGSPRMDGYTVTRAGHGTKVDRIQGYSFESLAWNYINRSLEPMLVRMEPHEDESKEPALVSHHGQEFNYVLEGVVKVIIGARSFVLYPGDSVYFDARQSHGQRAIGGPAVFLTIIQNEAPRDD
ncbi:MAG: helix-turn-helix domain-containing protein [Kiritimatiellia bacterium]|jgi:transcriptional regulator with XRE-family HTH domain